MEDEMNAPLPTLKPGIHRISMAEYLDIKALSSGLCNTILQCSPYHAKHEQDGRPNDPSSESDIGTAIHDALLEGIDRIAVIDADDWRTKAAKEAREQARAAGQIPMLARRVAQIEAAVESAKAFIASSELAGVFDDGAPEQTIIWREGDVLCKARPDWLGADLSVILHVKTTAGSAQPDSWIRNQLIGCGYDVAAAFYERAVYSLPGEGKDAPTSVFLVIEQEPPHGCSLVGLAPALVDLASRKAERAIRTWQKCHKSGRFPCYPTRIAYAEPRPWDIAQEEERDVLFTEEQLKGGVPL